MHWCEALLIERLSAKKSLYMVHVIWPQNLPLKPGSHMPQTYLQFCSGMPAKLTRVQLSRHAGSKDLRWFLMPEQCPRHVKVIWEPGLNLLHYLPSLSCYRIENRSLLYLLCGPRLKFGKFAQLLLKKQWCMVGFFHLDSKEILHDTSSGSVSGSHHVLIFHIQPTLLTWKPVCGPKQKKFSKFGFKAI